MPFFLFGVFAGLILSASVLVIFVVNPIESVLCLVLTFISAAMLIFLLQIEFIPLVLIVVYVGAIAVLFLFIVMMLNIKLTSKSEDFFKYVPFGTFVASIFIITVFMGQGKVFSMPVVETKTFFQEANWFLMFDDISNVEVLGKVLYTEFFVFFFIGGIILLVAMVGAISLTLKCNKTVKSQVFHRQLSRDSQRAVFLIRS